MFVNRADEEIIYAKKPVLSRALQSMLGNFKINKVNLCGFKLGAVRALIEIPEKVAFLVFKFFFKRVLANSDIQEEEDPVWVNGVQFDDEAVFSLDLNGIVGSVLADLVESHATFKYSEFIQLAFKSLKFYNFGIQLFDIIQMRDHFYI